MNRILLMADIHIGSIKDINYIYNITTDILEKELCFKKTDAVVILGDYFDRLFKVNEEYTSLAINIMSYLVRLCQKSNTKIRLIYGTESHEMGQYKLFNYHLNESGVDLKIIDTVMKEELLSGINVLYLPEEYVESKESHYKEYLYSNNSYDYIFGHGIIVEGMPMMQFDTGAKSNEKKVPHFKSGELLSICKLCVFGHYHVHNEYYLGSLFRDSFGEEEPKGYGIIEDYKLTFIENPHAYIYKTYTFEEDSEIYKNSDNIIKEIKKVKYENEKIFKGEINGRIRLIFKTPKDLDPSFRENLRSLLFNDKYISPLIKESSLDLAEEVQEVIDQEYDFILDNSLIVTDKIHQFINKFYGYDISLAAVTRYINEELKIK